MLGYRGTVAYRTSNPGHEGCDTLKQAPLPAVDPKLYEPFNWRIFDKLDHVVADALHAAQRKEKTRADPRFLVLNTSAMSGLRPDGKHVYEGYGGAVDCLHSCAPGPIDFANRLLFNAL
jgi:hypothetical protein